MLKEEINLKTLLILGYDSNPATDKEAVIKKNGFEEVTTVCLTYKEVPDPYTNVREIALNLQPELIIGTSLGGYIAFWLAEEFGIPCLLFNPPMETRRVGASPYTGLLRCPMRLVVLGQKDRVVNPLFNQRFFEKKQRVNCVQKIITCSWIEHTLDKEEFADMFVWALIYLKKMKKNIK